MDKKYLSITPEVEAAFAKNRPVVALESTILTHGMAYPENVEFSRRVEEAIRDEGAVPATCAIMGGYLKIGLNADELEALCRAEGVGKVSRRDMAVYLATGKTGATTAAATMMLAEMAGIHIFATGGIGGGAHRGGEACMDIPADLQELAHTSVAVVCAGAKSPPDIGYTLKYLESMGVPVMGLDTDDFPTFHSRKSGHRVDFNAKDAETVAWVLYTKWRLGLAGGAVVVSPIPAEYELNSDDMEVVIRRALATTKRNRARGAGTTPLLRSHSKDHTDVGSLSSNPELAYSNARSAARIAIEYVKAEQQCIT